MCLYNDRQAVLGKDTATLAAEAQALVSPNARDASAPGAKEEEEDGMTRLESEEEEEEQDMEDEAEEEEVDEEVEEQEPGTDED